MSEMGRLSWLCRRGMKELDVLFKNYLEHVYPAASVEDQQAFESILEMPDPELYDLILGRFQSEDADIARLIEFLRKSLTE
jgi:antitoxin CptB